MTAKRLLIGMLAAMMVGPSIAQVPVPSTEPVKKLSWMVGEWTSADKISDGMGGEIETAGTSSSKFMLGDRYIHMTVKMSMGEFGSLEGLTMVTFNELKDRYEAIWFDNMSGQSVPTHGTLEGDKLVLTSEEIDYPGMGKVKFRSTYTKLSDKTMSMKLEMGTGSEWTTQINSVYTKK